MVDSIPECGTSSDLSARLQRVAADPELIGQLYRVLGGFCHEVRNDLNGLKMSLYLAGHWDPSPGDGPVSLGGAQAHYDLLENLVERIHRFCRGGVASPLVMPVGLLFEDRRPSWAEALRSRGRSLTLQPPPEEFSWSYDPGRLTPALEDLFAWRLDAAAPGSNLVIGWRRGGNQLIVDWHELPPKGKARPAGDPRRGPGSPEPARARPLALLSLPALIQVVAQHGGAVEVTASEGWRLRMQWPRTGTENAGDRDVVNSRLGRIERAAAL